VLERAHGRCEDCGDGGSLELHHLRYHTELSHDYKYGGELIFGKETPNDLAALCRDCHLQRHLDPNGDYCAAGGQVAGTRKITATMWEDRQPPTARFHGRSLAWPN
jgi:hypothetical protein